MQNTLRFEENSGQSFSSDKVEKEVKYIGFIGALVTCLEVDDGYGDQSRVPEKDVPSHGLRKQQFGGLIFGAEVEIPVEFDLRTLEGLHCDLGRGQERRTWNPWIIYHQPGKNWNIMFQHFELLDDRHAKRAVQRKVIMEEHRVSMEAYKKVYQETVRFEQMIKIVQQSMEMDMWEINEKLAERREQMDIRAYDVDNGHGEWNQKI
ncbi:hypothetical protein Tco_0493898 [Tanacetum coccineum]